MRTILTIDPHAPQTTREDSINAVVRNRQQSSTVRSEIIAMESSKSGSKMIAGIALTVRDPEALAAFYGNVLGMTRQQVLLEDEEGDDGTAEHIISVGYGGLSAALILRKSPDSTDSSEYVRKATSKTDRYWKIAITVPNLDVAHAQIVEKGVAATEPHQFRDIAYLSHLVDPEGHVIELIQHTFQGKPRSDNNGADHSSTQPLGGSARIGLITLRTADISADRKTCLDLGMAYMSRQAVSDLGFDLYFFGFANDNQCRPPNEEDVDAVENREWLWQRPYTTLEFQCVLDGPKIFPSATDPAKVLIQEENGKQSWLQ